MGLCGLEVHGECVAVQSVLLVLGEVVGDVVEGACTPVHVDGAVDVFLRHHFADLELAFVEQPFGLSLVTLVDDDGIDVKWRIGEVLCFGGTESFA